MTSLGIMNNQNTLSENGQILNIFISQKCKQMATVYNVN